jgi:hypothetical protein
MSLLRATLERSVPTPDGVTLLAADVMANGRVFVMERAEGAQLCVRWLEEGGERGPALLWDDEYCGDGAAFDPVTSTLIVALNGPPHLFDGVTGRLLGVLPGHDQPTYRATVAPGGRVVTECVGGTRRVTDLRALTVLSERSTGRFRGWSAPTGIWPGDPVLTTLSTVHADRWTTALIDEQTMAELGREVWPTGGGPAVHNTLPRPDRLEWVGLITEGLPERRGPTSIVHFTRDGARLIDEAPSTEGHPGVVRLRFLTADWLYTEGARRPHQLLNVRTGERRDCPLEGPVSHNGLMLSGEDCAVFELDTGAKVSLRSTSCTEDEPSPLSISHDGETVLVRTATALEWWRISR